jgi:hypothetical protein
MHADVELARLETALVTLNFRLGDDSISDLRDGLLATLCEDSCVVTPQEDSEHVRWSYTSPWRGVRSAGTCVPERAPRRARQLQLGWGRLQLQVRLVEAGRGRL